MGISEHKKYSIYSLLYGQTEFYIVPQVYVLLWIECVDFFLHCFGHKLYNRCREAKQLGKALAKFP